MKRSCVYIFGITLLLGVLSACAEKDSVLGEGVLRLQIAMERDVKVSTRALSSVEQDALKENCTVNIYSAKGLVRNYEGIQNIPEEMQLVSGNYTAIVSAGDSVSASFDKIFYKGIKPFEITSGGVASVDVTCTIANVLAVVNFDTSLTEAFQSYEVKVFTTNGTLEFTEDNKNAIGYYMLSENEKTLGWTFEAVTLLGDNYVKTGKIDVKSATRYDLNFNFSLEDYQTGGGMVQLNVDVTPIESKTDEVSVYQRPVFVGDNFSLTTPFYLEMGAGVETVLWVAATSSLQEASIFCEEFQNWGLPANEFNLLSVTDIEKEELSQQGLSINKFTDVVNGLENLKLTFSAELMSKITAVEGDYKIKLTATDSRNKNSQGVWNIVVSNSVVATEKVTYDDVWMSKATLRGVVVRETADLLRFRYRESETEDWNYVDALLLEGGKLSADITNLTPGVTYIYQAMAGETPSAITYSFTTEGRRQLPNSGFENWSGSSPLWIYGEGEQMFWDSGNKGSATLKKNVTTYIENDQHGGNRAAQLKSQHVSFLGIGKFAAGNLFTGQFVGTEDTTQGILSLGRPFGSTPSTLSVWYRAILGTIDYSETSMAPGGVQDTAIVYIALGDWDAPLEVHTKDKNSLFSKNDPHVIAYGELLIDKKVSEWTNYKIKLDYRSLSRKPKYIIVVASASKYGDYYTGSTGSTLWLDDFELIYE